MAKFFGKVGFALQVEEPEGSGVIVKKLTAHTYMGDVTKTSRALEDGTKVNSDLSVGNSISIVADAFFRDNFFAIQYIEWNGVCWTVSNVDVQHPRLICRLGGVYNGKKA